MGRGVERKLRNILKRDNALKIANRLRKPICGRCCTVSTFGFSFSPSKMWRCVGTAQSRRRRDGERRRLEDLAVKSHSQQSIRTSTTKREVKSAPGQDMQLATRNAPRNRRAPQLTATATATETATETATVMAAETYP